MIKWEHETDQWKIQIAAKVQREERIDHIFYRKRHAKWLKDFLTTRGVKFRCHYIGTQAVIVTTNTELCPCCFAPKKKGWTPHEYLRSL